ncbi:DUF5998 family protein [Brevibacterium litoralis]|uniref:DUF5998 family protein n=1 Tax=Brevibacterium litoralis TaxID=3138935 RepID=UPI0032EFA718
MPSSIPHDLVADLQSSGYYPQLTGSMLLESLYDEEVLAHLVHMDTHVDYDSIHRHVMAFLVTPTRLLFADVEDEPEEGVYRREPRGLTMSEEIPLSQLHTVRLNRVYAKPAESRAGDRPDEVALTLGWGGAGGLDLLPQGCPDPDCTADHGYNGRMVYDDVVVRVSAQAEGKDAVARAEHFVRTLRRAAFEARRQ